MKRYILPSLMFALGVGSGALGMKIKQLYTKQKPADASIVHYLEDIIDGRDPGAPTGYSMQAREDAKDLQRCYGIIKQNGKEIYRRLID